MLRPSCRRNRSAAKNSRAAPLPFSAMTRALPLSRHSRKRVAGASPFLGQLCVAGIKHGQCKLRRRDGLLFSEVSSAAQGGGVPQREKHSRVSFSPPLALRAGGGVGAAPLFPRPLGATVPLPESRRRSLPYFIAAGCCCFRAASRRDGMLRPSCRRNRSAAGKPARVRSLRPARPLMARYKMHKYCINMRNLSAATCLAATAICPAIVSRHPRRSALYRVALPIPP